MVFDQPPAGGGTYAIREALLLSGVLVNFLTAPLLPLSLKIVLVFEEKPEVYDERPLLSSSGNLFIDVGLRRAACGESSALVHSVNLHHVGGAADVHNASNDDDCLQGSGELLLD